MTSDLFSVIGRIVGEQARPYQTAGQTAVSADPGPTLQPAGVRRRFALRTVQDGKVVINGVTFRPDECWQKYDGRLDGMRFAFGLYWEGRKWLRTFVSLWGTERAYYSQDLDMDWPGPECVDGTFPWMWWRPV